MPDNKDRYDAVYADRLWNLLPEVYRAEAAADFTSNGPLREIVNRIGAQAAVLRRSIDRLWEDQSIESCDDWLIPYMADLLSTNLVASLDARGQRLDVAKTIYYRRRKGTVAVLEELAFDITGWDSRCVEFFRRMSRTRHNFDPEIGAPAETSDPAGYRKLQFAEGLIGRRTNTGIGGTADLRNVYGASRAQTAFDEYSHMADLRRGQGQTGWQNIPHLGVFLWRLYSFGVPETTPVPSTQCPGQYAMDPTGRDIPLFAASARAYGDQWKSPEEWQLPAPIDSFLMRASLQDLYASIDPADGISVAPNSLGVYLEQGSYYDLLTVDQVTADAHQKDAGFLIDPGRGRLIPRNNAPAGRIRVRYHYGFSSTIGAGPYDRRVLGQSVVTFAGAALSVTGGGSGLPAALAAAGGSGTVTLADSLTYDTVADAGGITQLMLRAENGQRPLIRLPVSPPASVWTFTGAPGPAPDTPDAQLVLDGVFVSGADIALAGSFDTVLLTCCTLDPGSYDAETGKFLKSADARDLTPTRLRILAGTDVRLLIVDRSIVGPIVVEGDGRVEQMRVTDSIIQSGGGDQAIVSGFGSVNLARTTVLGPASMHRLDASECILDGVVMVEDRQHGCVRFSATAAGGALPRAYESVQITAGAPLFTSRVFGDPGYAQLLAEADREIIPPAKPPAPMSPSPTILAGAWNGSEMGAFSREKNPIKERSLLIKYKEYMPLGLTPALIKVT